MGDVATGPVIVAVVAALAMCLPAWHVLSALLSDSYMTLYAGRWIAAHGVPHHEVFTLAARGRPWVDQQWLAELIDFEAWRIAGLAGVGLLNAVAIATAYAVLAAVALRRGASGIVTLACCAVALIIALPGMFVRAQDLALPLFAAGLALCLADAEHERPGRAIALAVPLLIVWANLHGSVLLGAGLIALYLLTRAAVTARAGDRRSAGRYVALAAAAALAPLVTPYGWHIVSYYRDLIGNPGVAAAAPEDRAPVPASIDALTFYLPLLVTGAILAIARTRARPLSPALVGSTVVTAAATLVASRNEVWFAMSAAVLIAVTARAWVPASRLRSPLIAGTAAATVVLTALAALLLIAPRGGYERDTPLRAIAAAARYADLHPGARILADNAASSALLWHDPELAGRVAFDARLERYSAADLQRWIAFQTAIAPGWRTTTAGYQVLVGSARYNPGLTARLSSTRGLTVLAADAGGVAAVTR